MNPALHDLRYAARVLGKSPGFTLIAVCTLALGIGANTALFTVANALLLRPLPWVQPERLALISLTDPSQAGAGGVFSFPRFTFLRESSRSFSRIAAFTNESFDLTGRGDPEQIAAARVSRDFFDVLGVRPLLGRTFLADEDQPGGRDAVLISHSLWMRQFAGDPRILGRTITLDSSPHVVAGVMPAGFQFAFLGAPVDIWAPKVFELNLATPDQIRAGAGYLNAVARLAGGTNLEQAQAEMDVLNRQYRREYPKMGDANPKLLLTAGNLREQLVGNVRPAVLILFGAVGLLLLIACANVASLLLSRAVGRRKEIAVRTALGASRTALVRQLLMESVLLAVVGGALGLVLSIWGTRALASIGGVNLPRADEIRTDGAVLAFSLGTSLLTGLLFGLAPALQNSRADLNSGLRDESRGTTGGSSRSRFRGALVIGQVALSMVLLIGAGLLVRSFAQLMNVSPGFDPSQVLTMSIALPPAKYLENHRMVAFFNDLVEAVERMPGVRSAAVASALPLNPTRFSPALLEGQPPLPMPQRPVFVIQMVSPGYFAAMRAPLLRGRAFDKGDDPQSALAAIVNQALVRRYWPNDNPVGKHIYLGRLTKPAKVVGVAGDIRNVRLAGEVQPEIYLPYAQRPWRNMNLVIRTAGDPPGLISAMRRQVTLLDRDQPVTAVQTLEEVLAGSRAQPRFTMLLLGVFSAVAMLLALVGLYGTLAYSAARRTQEMGIRMALGASRGDILALVLRQGMVLTAAGIGIGVAGSLAATRLLGSLLYRMSPADPATFLASALGFAAAAMLASCVPALRATRVDPAVALNRG